MSRAFRKEDDDRPERPPARPVGDRPNYVTKAGLRKLHEALEQARAAGDQRNIEYFDERITSAQVVDAGAAPAGEVAFGSVVTAREEKSGVEIHVRIVGEDEADPVHGTISWISPYAQALIGHRAGDRVVVQRPAGPATVVIEAVDAPQISIVIPVYDNWWMTARALSELERVAASSLLPFETIVVDNASSDETPHAIAEFAWVRYVRLESNRNFAGACNAGARLAQAPLLLFLNNDAYPLGDSLTPLVRALDREEVAIAGGALFFEDGTTQCAGFVVLPNAHWHYSYRNLPPELDGVTHPRDVPGVSGAAMAVRTQWFLEGGGFDESYVNGFEDVDLCMRAREEERTICYVPSARFAHYEGASAGRYDREAENELRFYRRWAPRFAGIPRTARGEVRGISVHAPAALAPFSAAALEDLEDALGSFGHPIVRGPVRPWHRLDQRFRRSAALGWFAGGVERPGIAIDRAPGEPATIHVHGATELRVPWLPCAAPERAAALAVRRSADRACTTVAIAGLESVSPDRENEVHAAIDELTTRLGASMYALPGRLDAAIPKTGVACVIAAGLTDESAFGNVLLAQAGLPTVVVASSELATLLAPDVALVAQRGEIAERVAYFLHDPGERARYGDLVAADTQRRFSPRRSAIRVVDLLCAARFGLERPAHARSNSPLRL